MDEDNYSDTYMLDRMCYLRAVSAELSYPPEESAEAVLVNENDVSEVQREKMVTQMAEKWLIARDMFDDLEAHGHDPKARVERYLEQNGSNSEKIDWSWLESNKYKKSE